MNKRKAFIPVIVLFTILTAFFIIGRSLLLSWGADQNVLLIGNFILFLVTVLSFTTAAKGIDAKNPHDFVRSVYGSIMIKLFLFIIAAFIYIAIYKKDLNKPALFTLMGLYLVYTFVEVRSLTGLLKKKSNA